MFYSTDISVTLWIINNNKKARTFNERQMRDRQGKAHYHLRKFRHLVKNAPLTIIKLNDNIDLLGGFYNFRLFTDSTSFNRFGYRNSWINRKYKKA
jgi:type I restriction enzyme M protein